MFNFMISVCQVPNCRQGQRVGSCFCESNRYYADISDLSNKVTQMLCDVNKINTECQYGNSGFMDTCSCSLERNDAYFVVAFNGRCTCNNDINYNKELVGESRISNGEFTNCLVI